MFEYLDHEKSKHAPVSFTNLTQIRKKNHSIYVQNAYEK